MTDDQTSSTEQAKTRQRAALLSRARHQLADATEEFQHGLSKIKDPGVRRDLTANYVDLLQNYLGKAQLRLTHYRGRLQLQRNAEQTAVLPEDDESVAVPKTDEHAADPPRPSPQPGQGDGGAGT